MITETVVFRLSANGRAVVGVSAGCERFSAFIESLIYALWLAVINVTLTAKFAKGLKRNLPFPLSRRTYPYFSSKFAHWVCLESSMRSKFIEEVQSFPCFNTIAQAI